MGFNSSFKVLRIVYHIPLASPHATWHNCVLSNKLYVIIFSLPLRERSAAMLQNFNSFRKVVGVDTDNFVESVRNFNSFRKVVGVDTGNFVESVRNFNSFRKVVGVDTENFVESVRNFVCNLQG